MVKIVLQLSSIATDEMHHFIRCRSTTQSRAQAAALWRYKVPASVHVVNPRSGMMIETNIETFEDVRGPFHQRVGELCGQHPGSKRRSRSSSRLMPRTASCTFVNDGGRGSRGDRVHVLSLHFRSLRRTRHGAHGDAARNPRDGRGIASKRRAGCERPRVASDGQRFNRVILLARSRRGF
jgi:hypothetical protein